MEAIINHRERTMRNGKCLIRIFALLLALLTLLTGCTAKRSPEPPLRTRVPLPTVPTVPSRQEEQTCKYYAPAEDFEGGRGTWADPYRIADAAQLALMSYLVAADPVYAGAYYELTCSVSLNDTSSFENWPQEPPEYLWEPVGRLGNSFSGVFDGNGYIVSGMYINTEAFLSGDYYQQNYGLFADVTGTVRNLTVEQSYVRVNGACNLGLVAGQVSDGRGRLENCKVDAIAECNSGNCGGIAGNVYAGTVDDCIFDGEIRGAGEEDYTNAGGILGAGRRAAVRGCINRGTVCDAQTAGGIVGWLRSGTVSACTNEGAVSGSKAGGVAGRVSDDSDSRGAYIRGCHDLGKVKTN